MPYEYVNRTTDRYKSDNRQEISCPVHSHYVALLLWGFARAILDVLNKHFQNALHISITHSALIQVTTYLGYFLMAIPAGFLSTGMVIAVE